MNMNVVDVFLGMESKQYQRAKRQGQLKRCMGDINRGLAALKGVDEKDTAGIALRTPEEKVKTTDWLRGIMLGLAGPVTYGKGNALLDGGARTMEDAYGIADGNVIATRLRAYREGEEQRSLCGYLGGEDLWMWKYRQEGEISTLAFYNSSAQRGLVIPWWLYGRWWEFLGLLDTVGTREEQEAKDALVILKWGLQKWRTSVERAMGTDREVAVVGSRLTQSILRVVGDSGERSLLAAVGVEESGPVVTKKYTGKKKELEDVPEEVMGLQPAVGRLLYMDTDQRIAEFGVSRSPWDWMSSEGRDKPVPMSTCKVLGGEWLKDKWAVARYREDVRAAYDGMVVALPNRVWDALAWIMQNGIWLLPKMGTVAGSPWNGWTIPSWNGECKWNGFAGRAGGERMCTGSAGPAYALASMHGKSRKVRVAILGYGIMTSDWGMGDTGVFMLPDEWVLTLGKMLRSEYNPVAARQCRRGEGPMVEVVGQVLRKWGWPAVHRGKLGRLHTQVHIDYYNYTSQYRFEFCKAVLEKMVALDGDDVYTTDRILGDRGWLRTPGPVMAHVGGDSGAYHVAGAATVQEMWDGSYSGGGYSMSGGMIYAMNNPNVRWMGKPIAKGSRAKELCGDGYATQAPEPTAALE